MIDARRPILLLAATAVLASGWLLWQGFADDGQTASAPRPARPSTGRGRQQRRDFPAGAPRLVEGSRTAGAGSRPAGDPARGGGAVTPAPAVRGIAPLGAGEDPPPDPVVVAKEQRLRSSVTAVVERVARQGTPGVRVVFADCSGQEGEPCLARVEASTPAAINRVVEDARKDPSLASIRVREHPTAMNGLVWHADIEPRFAP